MRAFIRNLLVGPFPQPHRYVRPALQNQWHNIVAIWKNERDATFGIERLFRLILALSAYLFPGIYIRDVSGRRGLIARKLALDFYVSLKLVLPLAAFALSPQPNRWLVALFCYLGVETLFYVGSLLFISDVYKPPISQKRSYLMFMMNYVEICLDFAVIYSGLDLVSNVCSPVDAIYFSFVTGFTIGYGDMTPTSPVGRLLVAFQAVCCLFFVTLALAKAVASFDTNRAKPIDEKKDNG
jgi:Ion channel